MYFNMAIHIGLCRFVHNISTNISEVWANAETYDYFIYLLQYPIFLTSLTEWFFDLLYLLCDSENDPLNFRDCSIVW